MICGPNISSFFDMMIFTGLKETRIERDRGVFLKWIDRQIALKNGNATEIDQIL